MTDHTAIPRWQPRTAYKAGDVVRNGQRLWMMTRDQVSGDTFLGSAFIIPCKISEIGVNALPLFDGENQ